MKTTVTIEIELPDEIADEMEVESIRIDKSQLLHVIAGSQLHRASCGATVQLRRKWQWPEQLSEEVQAIAWKGDRVYFLNRRDAEYVDCHWEGVILYFTAKELLLVGIEPPPQTEDWRDSKKCRPEE
jgi:hypothetical protein